MSTEVPEWRGQSRQHSVHLSISNSEQTGRFYALESGPRPWAAGLFFCSQNGDLKIVAAIFYWEEKERGEVEGRKAICLHHYTFPTSQFISFIQSVGK